MSTRDFAATLGQIATILFVTGGLAVIVRAMALARLLLFGAVGIVAAAVFVPSLANGTASLGPWDLFVLVSGVVGVIALAAGRMRTGLGLLWPPFSRWIVWPALTPYLVQHWMMIALMLAPFTLFILIWIQQQALTRIYGEHAAGHVTGVYLVRALDMTGRSLRWLVTLPFRLLGSNSRRR